MLALVVENVIIRIFLFVEGVMLKSLACHSIAGLCHHPQEMSASDCHSFSDSDPHHAHTFGPLLAQSF